MEVNTLFLVSIILLGLSRAILAIDQGTFATARLLHNRAIVFIELKHGNRFANYVCGNLIHRSFVISTSTPFHDVQYKNYNAYVRIGSLWSFEGGTVKRTDGYYWMNPLASTDAEFFMYLVRLATPYNSPGDVDFGFAAYSSYRPRGMLQADRTIMPFIISGYKHPRYFQVSRNLTYAQVKESYSEDFCKSFYYLDKYNLTEGPRQILNCYVDWRCKGGPCNTAMCTSRDDDGGGMYYKNTNILVAIAHTRNRRKFSDRAVPLVGYVDKVWRSINNMIQAERKDEFKGYPEFSNGYDPFP